MRLIVFASIVLAVLFFSMPCLATDQSGNDQNIVLVTATGKIDGSLQLPASKDKLPVVLIIAGSGPTDRDGNSAGLKGKNNSLKLLAESMVQARVASVRFDKRGIAASKAAAIRKRAT